MKRFFPSSVGYIVLVLSCLTISGVPDEGVLRFSLVLGSWSNTGRSFLFQESAKNIFLNNKSKLVMVSFHPGSDYAKSLLHDPRTFAYFSSPETRVGRAILTVNSSAERDDLAALAHEDIGACGALEILDPQTNLATLTRGNAASPLVPTSVKSSSITSILSDVSSENIKATTLTLQNQSTRYHADTSPNIPSDAIYASWQALLPSGASVTQESHTGTSQKSVIAKIPASTASTETVVLGAHLDSINRSDQSQAPGADDDASGVAALTEILRLIKAKNMLFKRNVELHAYAAEEVGLIGSADIAGKRKNAGSTIVSMLQLDMIGYSSILNDETIHIITTDTSPVLVRHLKDLISIYLGGTWKSGALSPGTSDHKSWTNQGYHAAFAFENPNDYNRALHTIEDLVGRLNFTLAARFTKLALAFLSHEAGYTAAVSDSATEWAAQQATSGDIRLAALTGSNGGDRLVASVSETAASVEFCKIVSGTEMGCQSMMTDTALATQKSGRAFFVSAEDVAIAENDIWRVSAYAADGKMIAMRRMRLRKN